MIQRRRTRQKDLNKRDETSKAVKIDETLIRLARQLKV